MKTIIAGSRTVTDAAALEAAVASCPWWAEITEVISGACRGVDRLGEDWAKRAGLPVRRFPAQWAKYGKGAGPIRNRIMAAHADALIAVRCEGSSPGTDDMVAAMRDLGKRVHVYRVREG